MSKSRLFDNKDARHLYEDVKLMMQQEETSTTKQDDKRFGCNRERYIDLSYITLFTCSYDSNYLNVTNESKQNKHHAKCDQWQKEFQALEEACSPNRK